MDSTTKTTSFQQKLKNLPAEILAQPRFFKVGADKVPLIKDWSNPHNQKHYTEIEGLAGFDCSGHGAADDYCLLDFDHVLDSDGEEVNENVRKFLNDTLFDLWSDSEKTFCYSEKSISGRGIHFLIKPTADKFEKISGGKRGTLYFDDIQGKDSPKCEIFFKSAGRYCLLTGRRYQCDFDAPITCGETADKYLSHILDLIQKQNQPAQKEKSVKPISAETNNLPKKKFVSETETFTDLDRARAMLDCIDVSQLSDSDWLACMSACKNIGISYSDVDAKNATDSARYNENENSARWQSLSDSSFDIECLHGLAKKFGYSEKDFQRDWYQQHTNNKSVAQSVNEKSDSRKLSREEKFALFSLPHSDLFNAQRLSMFHGKHIRFLTDSARWCVYDGKMWQDSGKENSAILPFCIDLSHTISANVDETIDADTKLVKKWQDRKTFSAAIEILKGVNVVRITEQDLNKHPHLLNCKNGVVDLQTGELYPHDSKLLLTQCVNAEYRAGYRNERVDKFLREILPDEQTLQALLRFLGYCLTGSVQEEKALFIHGLGGNGKGTLTRFLLNLFDNYGCGFPIEATLIQPRITKNADDCTPAFNKLQWRRLAISEEIPAGRKLDYAKFKLLTGGDALPIRKLFSEATEIKNPTHKMIFSGNHLPELDDTHDTGILRRWIQIKFEQDFTGSNCDTKLKQFLQTDDALSALLTLLVDNAIAWYKDGLIISDKMQRDRNSYFAENDFLNDFISSYCVRDNDKSIPLKEFLNKLRDVCSDETRGITDRALSNMLDKIPFISKRRSTGGIRKIFGIDWREDTLDFEGENISSDDLPPM